MAIVCLLGLPSSGSVVAVCRKFMVCIGHSFYIVAYGLHKP